ncbi:hypothetical protein Tco_1493190 [Tanacetum coccineum]
MLGYHDSKTTGLDESQGSTLKQSTAEPAHIPKGYTQAISSKLLQIDEDAMEEIDIRWQVAMITARIRKFMRKTGENKANGRNEKRIVAIEDSNSKALVATDNNEDIDWTKEFDAEPSSCTFGTRWTEEDLKDYAIIDSGCSGSMTGDKDKLSDFKRVQRWICVLWNDSNRLEESQERNIKNIMLRF